MYPFKFSVVNEGSTEIIKIESNPIFITVYQLAKHKFQKRPNELHWICDHLDEYFVFETTGYSPTANPMFIIALECAIYWYAKNVLDNPEVEIYNTNANKMQQQHLLN